MKVLHVATMTNSSGVASFLMNYYRNINRGEIQFDFLSTSLSESDYSEEIYKLGGNIFFVSKYKGHLLEYIINVKNVIENGAYDIIHCHEFLLSVISLSLAKKKGIKTRIIHSHSNYISSKYKRLLVYLFRNFWSLFATDFFACSIEAAHFLFGKRYKYEIFNNAIEPEKFIFNNTARNDIRNDLRLSKNAFVIGYVARLDKGKNHFFLINLFRIIVQENINAYLLLIGEGTLQEEIKKYVAALGILNNVFFYGVTKKVHELYSVMDVFVFPSLFEGFGIVGIEAQCAGLPVIASTNIPKAMQVTNLVHWLDLEIGAEEWAKKVLEFSMFHKRMNMSKIITQNGYNIKIECKKLEMEYFRLKK